MSAVTLTKTPGRVTLPSCPDWCVRDHADDDSFTYVHGSEFECPADNYAFTARVMWVEHRRPQDAGFGGVTVHVSAGGGLLPVPPEKARDLAKVLTSLGKPAEAEVVREAARLAERAVRELRGSGQ